MIHETHPWAILADDGHGNVAGIMRFPTEREALRIMHAARDSFGPISLDANWWFVQKRDYPIPEDELVAKYHRQK